MTIPDPGQLAGLIEYLPADSPNGDDLKIARQVGGLSRAQLAAWAGVSVRTIYRQEAGAVPVGLAIYRLALILAGALPWVTWRGWIARHGKLFGPGDNRGFDGDQLAAYRYTIQLCEELRKRVKGSKVEIERLQSEIARFQLALEQARQARPARRAPSARAVNRDHAWLAKH